MANRLVTWRKDGARKGLGSARRTAHDGLTPPLIVDSDKPNAKRRGSGKFIRSPQAFLLEKYQGMKKVSKMAKVDIGTKRVCPECEAKFYDLNRNPAICPMCQHSFDPSELDPNVILPTAPLKPQTSKADDDGDEDMGDAVEVDEDDIDEEEQAAKELELDGDDAAIISGGVGDDDADAPDFDGFSTDEDEDQDAALVVDDENDTLPPGAEDDDEDEIEI